MFKVIRWPRPRLQYSTVPLKAAVVHALGAPLQAIWRVAAEPLSIAELVAAGDGWELRRLNVPG